MFLTELMKPADLTAASRADSRLRTLRRVDAARGPYIVFWELTQACQLACKHCRASAMPCRDPLELTTQEGERLLCELASFASLEHAAPLVVLTGGDPLERDDLELLVRKGVDLGLEMALTPSATARLTQDAMTRLQQAGLSRIAVSLDGACAETHDGFRGVHGSFDRTLAAMTHANLLGLPLQINTTLLRDNACELESLGTLLSRFELALWSLFFLVPVGRGQAQRRLSSDESEAMFERIVSLSERLPFPLKTTEAPHYRRYLLMTHDGIGAAARMSARAPLGITDGKGTMFVSHRGEIYPSGFLPIPCGRYPKDSVVTVYRNHPLFNQLRDADSLKGKCRACKYRQVCGGSRARAYAIENDPLAAEPDCSYVPEGYISVPSCT